jgi:hypothetical protein
MTVSVGRAFDCSSAKWQEQHTNATSCNFPPRYRLQLLIHRIIELQRFLDSSLSLSTHPKTNRPTVRIDAFSNVRDQADLSFVLIVLLRLVVLCASCLGVIADPYKWSTDNARNEMVGVHCCDVM